MQIMRGLCQAKYGFEMTRLETAYLLTQMARHRPLDGRSVCIAAIQGPRKRDELSKQHHAVVEHSRASLDQLYLKSLQEEQDMYQKQYGQLIDSMWADHRSMNVDHPLSRLMIELIDRRCEKIGARLECIYQFEKQTDSCVHE